MIQDIFPKEYHVEFAWKEPKAEDLCFVFRRGDVLEHLKGEELSLPTYGELEAYAQKTFYLFQVDDRD